MADNINEYEKNGYLIREYLSDGVITHVVEEFISRGDIQPIQPIEPQPTQEELQAQTLLNTELLLVYKEIGM